MFCGPLLKAACQNKERMLHTICNPQFFQENNASIILFIFISDYMRQAQSVGGGSSNYPPRSGYDELDTTLMPPRPGEQYGRGSSPATAGSGGSGGGGSAGAAAAPHPAGVNPHANFVPAGGISISLLIPFSLFFIFYFFIFLFFLFFCSVF